MKHIIIQVFLGIIIIGVGISILMHSHLGTDPFTTLAVGVSETFDIRFSYVQMLLLGSLLIVVLWGNKHYIGIGTLINLIVLGFVVDTSYDFFENIFITPNTITSYILLLLGVVIVCFGAALYMNGDLGLASYDAIALIIEEKTKIPFKYSRILTDSICVLIGFLLGAVVGIGTLIMAFFTGPLIAYFRNRLPS